MTVNVVINNSNKLGLSSAKLTAEKNAEKALAVLKCLGSICSRKLTPIKI